MAPLQVNQASLPINASHKWEKKDKYTKLSFDWADPKNRGDGTVSVTIGDEPSCSKSVPQANIDISNKSGKITNNTDKTINYTLS